MSNKSTLKAMERYLAAHSSCAQHSGGTCQCEASAQRLEAAKKELQAENTRSPAGPAIRKILVAVDHERHPAMETALMIAGPLHAQVALVYVLEPMAPVNTETAYVYTETVKELRANAQALLDKIHGSVPADALAFTSLREGKAADEIVAAARDFSADMIVMGTHRRGPLARFFLGSASQGVLRQAQCPVLLVSDVPASTEPPKVVPGV